MKNNKKQSNLKNKIAGIVNFLTLGIWHLKVKERPKHEFFLITALTYYTLLSIVPILALAFGIAKGFNFDTKLRTQLLNSFDARIVVATNVVPGYAVVTHSTLYSKKSWTSLIKHLIVLAEALSRVSVSLCSFGRLLKSSDRSNIRLTRFGGLKKQDILGESLLIIFQL